MIHSAFARKAGIILLTLLFGGVFLRAQEEPVTQAQWDQLLFTAAREGKSEAVAEILDNQYAAVDAADEDGWTPLFHAATADGDPGETVTLLLTHGANPDQKNRKHNTVLMLAAIKGNAACVRALLAGGADRTLTNDAGLTAAQIAQNRGQAAIAMLLRAPDFSFSPLNHPVSGVLPEPGTDDSQRELLQACADENISEVKSLLAGGADPDQAGAKGMTCLMISAFKGNDALVKLLLHAGANPALRLDGQTTAAELAARQNHMETAALIRNW